MAPPSECPLSQILHNRHLSITDTMHSPCGVRYGQVSLYLEMLTHVDITDDLMKLQISTLYNYVVYNNTI